MNRTWGIPLLSLMGWLGGCAANPVAPPPPASQASAATDEQRADPQWWLDQPASGSVTGADFEHLWETAERVSRKYLFEIDRRDRRGGLLSTDPTVSAQWFEPWRRELQTGSDLADSSMATHRRTIYYRFEKSDDGSYSVTPRVLVERQALAEKRVSGALSRSHFRRAPGEAATGTRETDQGVYLPSAYWYPVGRDHAFEQKLVAELRASLR